MHKVDYRLTTLPINDSMTIPAELAEQSRSGDSIRKKNRFLPEEKIFELIRASNATKLEICLETVGHRDVGRPNSRLITGAVSERL